MDKEIEMKKAVITLLGMVGTKYNKEKKYIFDEDKKASIYQVDKSLIELKTNKYINTLPLLIDGFSNRDIIPIATQTAKDAQQEVLKSLNKDTQLLKNTLIISDNNYEETFQKISELLQDEKYESFIIDLTHGFRHLPILMIINLIISSMKDTEKIEHIFFAKEIEQFKKYEIIDLLDYVGLAKLSFVLENFNTNYTVGNKISFRNEKYQELVNNLRIISGHILGNSIKRLIANDNNESLVKTTIKKLEELKRTDKNIQTFSTSIESIIKHLNKMDALTKEKESIKLFKFAEMMHKRDYLLNAITLLNESIGMYCADKIKKIVPMHIEAYKNREESSLYELVHHSKNIIFREGKFSGAYLFDPNKKTLTSGQKTSLQEKKKKVKKCIPSNCMETIKEAGFKIELGEIDIASDKSIKRTVIDTLSMQDNKKLKSLIEEVSNLRNNLAHGNSAEEMGDVKSSIGEVLKKFNQMLDDESKEETKTPSPNKQVPRKLKKPKVNPTGIDAPKEKINKLADKFNNR